MKRPRWSLKSSFVFAIFSMATIAATTLLLVKRSIWVELEIVVAMLSAFLFLFFFVVLYTGVRFQTDERFTFSWMAPEKVLKNPPDLFHTWGMFAGVGAEMGLVGFLLGVLVDLVASAVLIVLIVVFSWLGVNVVIAAVAALFLPLFYVFRRSLRYVVARGRACRGDVAASLRWSAGYTLTNGLWIYAILAAGHFIAAARVSNIP